jgi:hypothetical protein
MLRRAVIPANPDVAGSDANDEIAQRYTETRAGERI